MGLTLLLLAALGWAAPARAQGHQPELTALRVERADGDLYLSAQIRMELAPAVEEALLKGIPVHFVAEAEIVRDRWYWADKRVADVQRHMRVSYQPLTRRWRLQTSSEAIENAGLGVNLSQYYDSLPEVMAAVLRISRWKIADAADLDLDARQTLRFRFRLDVSQLPRALQIGAVGHSAWNVALERKVDLSLEAIR